VKRKIYGKKSDIR